MFGAEPQRLPMFRNKSRQETKRPLTAYNSRELPGLIAQQLSFMFSFVVVHPSVRNDLKFFHADGIIRIYGISAADPRVYLHPVDNDRPADDLLKPLHQLAATLAVQPAFARNHQRKLVAANAENLIQTADTALEPASNDTEQFVADAMAIGIVDLLKPIQIQEEQRKLRSSSKIYSFS